MVNFIKIFESIGNKKEREFDKVFESGKKAGYEEGVRDGRLQVIKETVALSEEETHKLMTFLAERSMVITYDPSIGGIRIRKAGDKTLNV